MTAAAITGSFADFKIIRTRSVCQLVIEVPLEQADAALAALGGVPQPATERPVAIARLTPEAAERKPDARDGGREAVRRAGILAKDATFQRWIGVARSGDPDEAAAHFIRQDCNVQSRAEIATDPAALERFLALETAFKYRDTPYAGGKR